MNKEKNSSNWLVAIVLIPIIFIQAILLLHLNSLRDEMSDLRTQMEAISNSARNKREASSLIDCSHCPGYAKRRRKGYIKVSVEPPRAGSDGRKTFLASQQPTASYYSRTTSVPTFSARLSPTQASLGYGGSSTDYAYPGLGGYSSWYSYGYTYPTSSQSWSNPSRPASQSYNPNLGTPSSFSYQYPATSYDYNKGWNYPSRGQGGNYYGIPSSLATGSVGVPGLAGARGMPGEPGHPGRPGEPGEPGRPGIPGRIGEQGDIGDPGLPGQFHNRGAVGVRGFPGSRGREGGMGAPGVQGPPGERGDPGYSGQRGLDGATGLSGSSGLPGLPGLHGTRGMPGEPGARGFVGSPGYSGRPGENGITGIPGPTRPSVYQTMSPCDLENIGCTPGNSDLNSFPSDRGSIAYKSLDGGDRKISGRNEETSMRGDLGDSGWPTSLAASEEEWRTTASPPTSTIGFITTEPPRPTTSSGPFVGKELILYKLQIRNFNHTAVDAQQYFTTFKTTTTTTTTPKPPDKPSGFDFMISSQARDYIPAYKEHKRR